MNRVKVYWHTTGSRSLIVDTAIRPIFHESYRNGVSLATRDGTMGMKCAVLEYSEIRCQHNVFSLSPNTETCKMVTVVLHGQRLVVVVNLICDWYQYARSSSWWSMVGVRVCHDDDDVRDSS